MATVAMVDMLHRDMRENPIQLNEELYAKYLNITLNVFIFLKYMILFVLILLANEKLHGENNLPVLLLLLLL